MLWGRRERGEVVERGSNREERGVKQQLTAGILSLPELKRLGGPKSGSGVGCKQNST